MIKPSTAEYDYTKTHAWTCPNIQVQCPCLTVVPNDEASKRLHVETVCTYCMKRSLQVEEISWKFVGLVSCWSPFRCVMCNTPLPGAPVTSLSRSASGGEEGVEGLAQYPDDMTPMADVVPPPPDVTPEVRNMWETPDRPQAAPAVHPRAAALAASTSTCAAATAATAPGTTASAAAAPATFLP